MMGPMSGLISIAPMTTAVELTLQSNRADEDAEYENPKVKSSKFHIALDPLNGVLGSATSMILNRSMANGFKSCARRSHKDRG